VSEQAVWDPTAELCKNALPNQEVMENPFRAGLHNGLYNGHRAGCPPWVKNWASAICEADGHPIRPIVAAVPLHMSRQHPHSRDNICHASAAKIRACGRRQIGLYQR
jgi:hypothetical protein